MDADETSIISGKIFNDKNKNKIKETTERYLGGQKVLLLPDSITAETNSDGQYRFFVEPGNYKVSYISNPAWNLSGTQSEYNVRAFYDTVVPDIAVYSSATQLSPKLKVLVRSTLARCGRDTKYYLDYTNTGNGTGDGQIRFTPDRRLKIKASYPTWDSISKDSTTFFWKFKALYPTEQRQIHLTVQNPGFEAMGDTMISTASAIVSSSYKNYDPGDGITQYLSIVACSYDPNDKAVEPMGVGTSHQTLFSDTLRYTIRFQNTGNDTAFDIKVLDTLSKKLDWSTFHVVASSHNVNTTIDKNGVVTFMFNNILLPDSGKDYLGSNGFVSYEIVPKNETLPFEVKNTGYIYFDYNPAVVTNIVSSEMVKELPWKVGVMKELKNEGMKELRIYPNPAKDEFILEISGQKDVAAKIMIYDIIGNIVYQYEGAFSKKIINLKEGKGIYYLKANIDGEVFMKKIVLIE